MIQTKVVDKYKGCEKSVITHKTEMLWDEAVFALSCIEKWGMTSLVPDGEDSSGRNKYRMMTPAELTTRAFETAALTYAHAKISGLVTYTGDISQLFVDDPEDK